MKLKRTLLSKPFSPWSSSWALGALVIFLAMSTPHWRGLPTATFLTANREQVFSRHEFYRLFTTLGMHADLRHFLGNSLFFFIFGFLLHSYFGWIWFPVLSLIAGGLVNAMTLWIYPPETTLIGCSGMVYFMAGAWATLYFFIERKSHWMKRLVAALGVSLILFFPTEYEPEVSYLAHALGFLFGMVFAFAYFRFRIAAIRRHEEWQIDWAEALNIETKPEIGLEASPHHVDLFHTEGE